MYVTKKGNNLHINLHVHVHVHTSQKKSKTCIQTYMYITNNCTHIDFHWTTFLLRYKSIYMYMDILEVGKIDTNDVHVPEGQ